MLGFKTSDVGVIPSDWSVKTIGEITTCTAGGTPSTKVSTYWGGTIPWMSSGELNLKYVHDVSGRITKEGLNNSSTKLIPKNCVLVGLAGQGKTRGTAAINLIPLCTNQSIAAILPSESFVPAYLYFNLDSRYHELRNLSSGGSGRGALNLKIIKSIPVPLPSLDEQHNIAQTLADLDKLLFSLDENIQKKRDIKQAVMQQLLMGKTRLPGFSGDWSIRLLGDISQIKTGKRNNEDKVEDGLYPFFVRSAIVEKINSYSYECEAILVPGEGQIGNIFHYVNERFDVHQRVYAITNFADGVVARYIHFFMSQHFGPWAMQNSVKATVDSLRLPTFESFEIRLPPSVEEQSAIVNILSAMEDELFNLEKRRIKVQDIKLAMMQELLSGKKRLTNGEHSNA